MRTTSSEVVFGYNILGVDFKMCTAISFNANGHFFGRNLDLDRGYGERVVITPRNFKFKMRCGEKLQKHYAIIGMAAVFDGCPLYFDAVNEKGLCMAGLNFPNNAVYHPENKEKINITPFEFIPYVLGRCKNIDETKELLSKINIVNISFNDKLPLSPLHWLVSDGEKSLTIESVNGGLKVYENMVGVLTNNPPFLKQMKNLEKYRSVFLQKPPQNDGGEDFGVGLDSKGLAGGFSSQDRFVRAVFVKQKSPTDIGGDVAINHFFHILGSVAMPKGCVITPTGEYEYTRYSCCIDCEKGDYYYTTYDSSEMIKVSLSDCDLSDSDIYICA